jgi:hypothetical protein
MNDKIITLSSILILALIIGVMSWHDMHPQLKTAAEADIVAGYYADKEATAGIIPDDDLPLTIAQGKLDDANGKTGFMPPMTIAQRQVNLLLSFEDIPKNPAVTFSKAKALIASWENQGSNIAIIFLDYRPKNPDFRAYSGFIKAFKKYLAATPHVLLPVIDLSWLDDQHKAGRQLLQQEAPLFLVDLDKTQLSAALIQKLANLKYGFQLVLPAGTLPAAIDGKALQKTGLFGGALLTLSPQQPILKKEPGIGVFPKL